MLQTIIEMLLKVYWIFPIKNNRVVFRSSQGNKYNCNPKYISEYLEKNGANEIELIWTFVNPDEYDFLKNRGIKVVKEKSLIGLYYMITAKFLIDNHGVQSYLPIRKNQEIINTWHGGGSYKRPYGNETKKHNEYVKKMNERTTAFISSCQKYSENNLSKILASHPEKILSFGMARNDLLFTENFELKRNIKEKLGIDQEVKIALYAPTFRDDGNMSVYIDDPTSIIHFLEKRFGGKFIFANRFHQFTKEKTNIPHSIDVNDYEDMQELLFVSDVVITDYSSVIWDASLANIPCFIYARDLDQYEDSRNFYTPIEEWPFPIARDMDELCMNIQNFNHDKYNEDVKKHHEALGSYEDGKASAKIYQYIISKMK